MDELTGQDFTKIQKLSALFLLKMKDQHKISQRAVDDIVYHSRNLVDDVTTRIKIGIESKLASAGINLADLPDLEDIFTQLHDPFDGIDTNFKQENYFKESLGLVVSQVISMYTGQSFI